MRGLKAETVKSSLSERHYFLQGDEVCAEGAIAAGCRFFAGYPISPANEVMERIVHRFPEVGGVFIQMEDEIASISAVIGASWAGAKAMTATSGPGMSLMMEGIGYSAMTETPCVIVDIQRVGPGTGQATRPAQGDMMQAKWGSHGDYQVIALSPWSVQEMYDGTIRAFNLAEAFRVPVFVMADEAVGHLREGCVINRGIEVFNRYKEPGKPPFGAQDVDGVPPMPSFGEGERLLITGSTHDDRGYRKTQDSKVQEILSNRLKDKILRYTDEITEIEEYHIEDAQVVIVAYGITARVALRAVKELRAEGYLVGFLRLKTVWPFPRDKVEDIADRVKVILVPEMNQGQIVGEVERVSSCDVIPLSKVNGEVFRPKEIIEAVKKVLS